MRTLWEMGHKYPAGSLGQPREGAQGVGDGQGSGVSLMHRSDGRPRREIMTALIQEHPEHVHEMMARLGIWPEAAVLPGLSLRYATALRRCKLCRSKTSCRDWLDYAPAMVNFAPDFCINADILFDLHTIKPDHVGSIEL